MIHVIMGLKGSGKTKKLLDAIHDAVAEAHGDVVCIEYGKHLTYDVTYKVRLVDSKEYGIKSPEMLKGFISGLHAGNYDITHVFIDNFFKIIDASDMAETEAILDWLNTFSEQQNVKFTISATADPETVSEGIRKYLI